MEVLKEIGGGGAHGQNMMYVFFLNKNMATFN